MADAEVEPSRLDAETARTSSDPRSGRHVEKERDASRPCGGRVGIGGSTFSLLASRW
jgi:hypothetical protein